MQLPERFTHHATGVLRIPVVDTGKQAKDRPWCHHIVEVTNHVVGIVQVQIRQTERQRQTCQTTNTEHRNESGSEQHRGIKSNRTTPHRNQQRGNQDHRRHRNQNRGYLEEGRDRRPHSSQIHVVSPHDESQETEHHHGVDHGLVAPQRTTSVTRDNLRNDRDRRQNQNIHLRVSQEPEQVLVKQRATTTGSIKCHTANIQASRNKETGSSHAVHQLHDRSHLKRRESQQQQETGDQHRPYKERHPHPAHATTAEIDDGTNEVHRT